MLCDICHKNVATVHLTEIIDEKVMELHICQKCANLKAEELKHQLSISDFLAGLMEKPAPRSKVPSPCPLCGLTFSEFKKQGKLGCYKCYQAFKDYLFPLLRKIHGAVQHIGKFPQTVDPNIIIDRKIEELKIRLARSIKLEEYEEAAKIRDQIRELEKKRNKKGNV